MSNRSYVAAALLAALTLLPAAPALAQGEILITQAKANAGNVTPGDAAGFPVTLSVHGSYKLASNLIPGPNLNGIVVAAPDVTIDLNGFVMSGGPAGGANNSKFGIVGQGDRLTVKNGTIGAFRIGGIYAKDRGYLIVENMRIINSYYGINNENGSYARIQNSTIATNITYGILCGNSCHVEGNVVSDNGTNGIRLSRGTVLGNTVYSNGSFGISSVFLMGLGNNTIFDNNPGSGQTDGGQIGLHPNACTPPSASC